MIHAMNDGLEPSQLYERVRMLFGVERPVTTPQLSDAKSPYAVANGIETFEVPGFPQAGCDATDLTDAWLSTPNPTFGNHRPNEFLHGSQDQRAVPRIHPVIV